MTKNKAQAALASGTFSSGHTGFMLQGESGLTRASAAKKPSGRIGFWFTLRQ
jgi:hypothetical protein